MNVRLQQFLGAENISQAQFADAIGVARASVSHILAGRNRPGYEFITSVMRHYPALNIEWLLSGKGKMYKESARPSSEEVQESGKLNQPPAEPTLFADEQPAATSRESEIPAPSGDMEQNTALTQRPEQPDYSSESADNQRTITKIMVFFSDNTFIEIS